MTEPAPGSSRLADLPDDALWTSRAWTEFRSSPPDLVILPLFGFADWGLGRPLDFEAVLGTAILRAAWSHTDPSTAAILPPLHFVHGPYPHTFFGLDFETACMQVREIGLGVRAAGVRRMVFFNTSPWNEDLVYATGCDLRVETGLAVYRIHLAALGFDLDPVRSPDRSIAQCAACACFGTAPEAGSPRESIANPALRPAFVRQPGAVPVPVALPEAIRRGEVAIEAAGARLAEWWRAIAHHEYPAAAEEPGQSEAPASRRE